MWLQYTSSTQLSNSMHAVSKQWILPVFAIHRMPMSIDLACSGGRGGRPSPRPAPRLRPRTRGDGCARCWPRRGRATRRRPRHCPDTRARSRNCWSSCRCAAAHLRPGKAVTDASDSLARFWHLQSYPCTHHHDCPNEPSHPAGSV